MGIVGFDAFCAHLGVGPTDPQIAAVVALYDAIGLRIAQITRRVFEGEATEYTEVIRLHGAQEFTLAHIPVVAVTSISRHNFDGTDDDPYEADRWRVEDLAHGRIRLKPSPEYVTVVYSTTGEIPATAVQAYLEWGRQRWGELERDPALTSYQTGQDSESYSVTLAGRPGREVVAMLLALRHETGGGVI